MVDELRRQIDHLESEVEFYRDELRDRRQSTTALTDVIRAFRLNAETNAQHSNVRRSDPHHDANAENDEPSPAPRSVTLSVRSEGDNRPSDPEGYRV
jgi:hypothetical protein